MNYKTIFIIFLYFPLFFFITGCHNVTKTDIIDLDREDDVSVHDIFSEISIVIPENRNDYMISTIYNIEYHNGKYYIFDIKSQQVFCLDDKGQFHFKISSAGSGPGEYIYVAHMSIDRINEQILLLEPSMQRLQIFDFNGHYLETINISNEVSLAYNYAFALNANTIVLISITGDQLVFFCRNKREIIETDFPMAISTGVSPFSPSYRSFYQLEDKSFFIPVFSQQIYDISDLQPQPHYKWDFGVNNNTREEYNNLISELKSKESRKMSKIDFVGRGKAINHSIVKIDETSRYIMAVIEYNNDFKNVIIDKKEDKSYVFRAFKEGVSLLFLNIFNHKAMASAAEYDYVSPALREERILSRFDPSVLKKNDLNRLENWDELQDNMFFVVYKFRD
ncbi:MAG: 6-bladed beta-propeller [Bacteroidota bacterium]